MTPLQCHRCGTPSPDDPRSFRAVCERCGAFLHCCRSCEHYEPGRHNDCREPNAERVADKEAGNFCDFFRPRPDPAPARVPPADDARARLDALFRKKPD